MTRILNQAQAEAVFSAMLALSTVGGKLHASFDDGRGTVATVTDHGETGIRVTSIDPRAQRIGDWHEDQTDFATAYGLQ